MDGEALFKIGERIFNLENLFNVRNSPWLPRAGIPEMFRQKPLTDGPSLGQTVDSASMVQDFYRSMGWDTEGRPRCSTLKNLEIADFARSGEYGSN